MAGATVPARGPGISVCSPAQSDDDICTSHSDRLLWSRPVRLVEPEPAAVDAGVCAVLFLCGQYGRGDWAVAVSPWSTIRDLAQGAALGVSMQWFEHLMANVLRPEAPVYARLYEWAKRLRAIRMPVIPGLHHSLYEENRLRRSLWQTVWCVAYYDPFFKTRCERVGRNLRTSGGLPLLMENPVRLRVGNDVCSVMTIVGLILKGVTIGAHAVVGAGSVVTREVPAWARSSREIRHAS